MYREAAQNPVAYGQANKARIRQLNSLVDQSLRPFDKAKPALEESLQSDDPLKRYWALVACSVFKDQAAVFDKTATRLAKSDPDTLVRMRAAQFLAFRGLQDPRPVMVDCLKKAQDMQEAAFILNTITLMHDGGYPFKLERSWLPDDWFADPQSNVSRRYDYIQGRL